MKLTGKIAVVPGASGGIGAGIAKAVPTFPASVPTPGPGSRI
ncbi:hypothetical protein ACFV8Z_42885 [Streptomyces sp. NPDC059837]|nr:MULTISPECIES: hypothetical protein [unclassified Streptomyces]MCX4410020.1 hypothetical protein [Streptomyces sp. NBC_01764]MCX5191794.1 hypothetical protein [Streptomyces sp. NBC_00268]